MAATAHGLIDQYVLNVSLGPDHCLITQYVPTDTSPAYTFYPALKRGGNKHFPYGFPVDPDEPV